MKHWNLFFINLALILLVGCARLTHQGGPNEYMTLATLWVQNSAEYRALSYQAYNLAQDRLGEYSDDQIRQRRMAVILDLDETVLDNSPYQAKMIRTGLSYHPDTWGDWIKMRRARAIPGAKDFLNYANARGFELFYISNRAVRHLEDTYQNMIELGLPVKRENISLRTTQMGKDARRARVKDKFEVVLLIGDVMTDFSDIFEDKTTNERHILTDQYAQEFGRRFIILPNPMYGEWERAIYGHDPHLSPQERFRRRQQALYSY